MQYAKARWSEVGFGIVAALLLSLGVPAFAADARSQKMISLDLENAEISELSLALSTQTEYRFGMPPDVQSVSEINIRLENVGLAHALQVIEQDYGVCAWKWLAPEGYQGPDLMEIRWAYCDNLAPDRFGNFVRWKEENTR